MFLLDLGLKSKISVLLVFGIVRSATKLDMYEMASSYPERWENNFNT